MARRSVDRQGWSLHGRWWSQAEHRENRWRDGTKRHLARRHVMRSSRRANPEETVPAVHPALHTFSLIQLVEKWRGSTGATRQDGLARHLGEDVAAAKDRRAVQLHTEGRPAVHA